MALLGDALATERCKLAWQSWILLLPWSRCLPSLLRSGSTAPCSLPHSLGSLTWKIKPLNLWAKTNLLSLLRWFCGALGHSDDKRKPVAGTRVITGLWRRETLFSLWNWIVGRIRRGRRQSRGCWRGELLWRVLWNVCRNWPRSWACMLGEERFTLYHENLGKPLLI